MENSDVSHLKSLGDGNTIVDCVFDGENIVVGNNCTLKSLVVRDGTTITDSHLRDCVIGEKCSIGPYSRIRGEVLIGNNCRIGNFVEIKNAKLGNGVKASHLSYLGDVIIGDNTNIGCGVVFANYNGKEKNVSVVGKECFVGCNSTIIAPVKIADETYICAGTTVTRSTNVGDFVIGRKRAETKEKYSFYKKNHLNVDKK